MCTELSKCLPPSPALVLFDLKWHRYIALSFSEGPPS